MKSSLLWLFCAAAAFSITPQLDAAEAIEIGKDNFDLLPRGKEADGIIGDFLLRNDKIEVVISGDLPLRRPNMGGFYGNGNHTPGVIYDLTKQGANNDQITIFTPCNQKGDVNYVRIAENGAEGRAVIETMTSTAKSGSLFRQHQYILEDGWEGVLIITTLRNESGQKQITSVADVWTQMRSKGSVDGIQWADAIDPADKCGYAYAWVKEEGVTEQPKGRELELNVGDAVTYARFLAVGDSPAEAVGIVSARRDSARTGKIRGAILDETGKGIATGRVLIGEKKVPAYPDKDGKIAIRFPIGEHELSVEDIGRETQLSIAAVQPTQAAEKENQPALFDVMLSKQSAVKLTVRDENGISIPCKAQFNPVEGTAKPNLGPTDRAHGCVDQWHSAHGDFRVPLPPGKYEVIVTHGPEFSHHKQVIDLKAGAEIGIAANLKRLIDTTGWISADYHNHSTPSGDNVCGTDDRLINLAAEQIEFAPTTEHNRIYDWEPHITRLKLTPFLKTVVGMELTGSGAHFNAFPLKPDPTKQDGGAPVWQKDPRLNAIVLRNFQGEEPDRWVHVNHPDMSENFIDWNRDGRADGGYAYFGKLLDGLESQNYRNSEILAPAPFTIGKTRGGLGSKVNLVREFIWLQLLNQGMTVWGIAVADAHHVHGNGVGGWRTYVPSKTDDPAKVDWREMTRHSKAGRMILSSGPFLEVETESGIIAGGLDRVSDTLNLKVKVQCTDWIDIDRVQILVNSRQVPELNFTREKNAKMFADGVVKFDHTIPIALSQDAHIIVVATGENSTLKTGFGSSAQSSIHPTAYNNPIFIDVDGGGFTPNYDTLGFDLPTSKLSVERVEKLLGK